ncbi:uncharacterized protein LOC118747958 [Rhagoletis pomonella]|uniref:uncharacterized protein LOC118747958 n=1 Tax=Rhagoletis pomonella TaxID=28610 RepID=UPI0017848394|nr:uncharacterized protein LOC118747958 [Rhagoletis pomonella]
MPLLLSNRSVDNFIVYYEHEQKYEKLFMQLEALPRVCWRLIKFCFGLDLLRALITKFFHSYKGIYDSDRLLMSCGSLYTALSRTYPEAQAPAKSTVIPVEASGERTPLFKGSKSYGGGTATAAIGDGYASKSGADSSYGSENDNSSIKGGKGIVNVAMRKHGKECCAYAQMMTFVSILAGGCVIAAYLLIAESRLPTLRFSLDLVHRHLWSNVSAPLAAILNHSNVLNIVIMQTGGTNCDKYEKCLQILRELQKQYQEKHGTAQEIPFNFLIGGDRQTYEARGWNYESGLPLVVVPQNASLVIAFIGNYTISAPNAMQLRSALSLIAESVRQKKLQRKYKIFGLQNSSDAYNDGKALFGAIGQWKQFDGLLEVI